MKFNTKTIHGGQHHEKVTGAVMPPVFQTSTYVQSSPGKPVGDYEYSRAANRNLQAYYTQRPKRNFGSIGSLMEISLFR